MYHNSLCTYNTRNQFQMFEHVPLRDANINNNTFCIEHQINFNQQQRNRRR